MAKKKDKYHIVTVRFKKEQIDVVSEYINKELDKPYSTPSNVCAMAILNEIKNIQAS